MSKIYLVAKSTGEYDTLSNSIVKAFKSKEKAEALCKELDDEIANIKPAIEEDIWDIIEWRVQDIIDEDETYQNNVEWSYPRENDEWDKRQEEVDKLVKELYIQEIMKEFPIVSCEDASEMYDKQMYYEDNRYAIYDYNGSSIEEIEFDEE